MSITLNKVIIRQQNIILNWILFKNWICSKNRINKIFNTIQKYDIKNWIENKFYLKINK